MRSRPLGRALLALAAAAWASSAGALSLTRIVDENTGRPAGGSFDGGFGRVTLSGEHVAFVGRSGSDEGIYVAHGGSVTAVAETGDPIPNQTVFFTSFSAPFDNDGSRVTFAAPVQQGAGVKFYVYAGDGGPLQAVADPTIALPVAGLGAARFAAVRSVEAGVAAIKGNGNAGAKVLYTTDGAGTNVIARSGDAVPTSPGETFGEFSPADVDVSGAVFNATSDLGVAGVYTDAGGSLREVVDVGTAIPGGHGSFATFPDPVIRDGSIVFSGGNGSGYEAVFREVGGVLTARIDSDTLIPGEATSFDEFPMAVFVADGIAFVGTDAAGTTGGLYYLTEAGILPLLRLGETLDGADVDAITLSNSGASGSRLGIRVGFADAPGAIYTVMVPEPGTGALVAAGLALLSLSRSRVRPTLPAALLALVLLSSACDPGPGAPVSGEALFRQLCVSCHGPGGRGDGPVAAELRRQPADLTVLARASGGKFDAEAVKEAIDGRRVVQAHGPREMPLWGVVFGAQHVGEPYYVHRSEQELDALVEYLRSLQVE